MEAFIRAGGLPEHYHCDTLNKTQEEWYAEGTPSYANGIFSLLLGICFQILYIPCLIVFHQKDLFHLTVYKIMFFITFVDLLNLTSNGILMGILFLDGAVYCNHPYVIYIWGCVEMAGWAGCCIGCLFLVLTRLIDLISPEMHELLFAGRRIVFTFAIILSYMTYFLLFSKPVLFNSTVTTWIFNPLIYTDGRDAEHFVGLAIILNNIGTVSATLLLYLAFFIVFAYKMKKTYNFKMDKKQKQILAQSCIICLNNLALALIYVWFIFMPPSAWLIAVSVRLWQFSSASGVFVFYVMNKTVRIRIFTLFGLQGLIKETTVCPSIAISKSQITH